MRNSIRPDVHARFLALVARADAKVRTEEQTRQKRSSTLMARETRERARTGTDHENDAG